MFDRRSFGHNKDNIASRKKQGPFSMDIGNVELCTSVFKNTCAWEQHERNKTKEEGKKRRVNMEGSTMGKKK